MSQESEIIAGGNGDLTPKLIGDRFHLLNPLGQGSTSKVYEAFDEILQRTVAVKLLDPNLYLDPVYNQRFEREAVALAKFSHKNIVTIHDFCYEEILKTYYLVLGIIKGRTLEEEIERLKDQDVKERIKFTLALLPGLEAALTHLHEAGVTHRDIKPQNIMVTEDNLPIMTDFGIARVSNFCNATLPGFSPGTPIFMSPEQLQGLEVDHRSDLYALAVLVYLLLTGRHPFPTPQDFGMLNIRLSMEPVPLGSNFKASTERVFLKALAFDPQARYQSAADFVEALKRTLVDEPATPIASLNQNPKPTVSDTPSQANKLKPVYKSEPSQKHSLEHTLHDPKPLTKVLSNTRKRRRKGIRLPRWLTITLALLAIGIATTLWLQLSGKTNTRIEPNLPAKHSDQPFISLKEF